jgi:hypothetical protein
MYFDMLMIFISVAQKLEAERGDVQSSPFSSSSQTAHCDV